MPCEVVGHDAAVMDGPETAVELVWREHGARLWRSLVAYTGDPEVASDAMAEAFAQALGRGDAVRDHAAWIWRASFKIAAGELARRPRSAVGDGAQSESAALPEPVTDLVVALRTLSPHQRAATVLHDYADLPTREVARILGCTPATVRVHLLQARRRLRSLLEDDDDRST